MCASTLAISASNHEKILPRCWHPIDMNHTLSHLASRGKGDFLQTEHRGKTRKKSRWIEK
jgi:hypothetical protein